MRTSLRWRPSLLPCWSGVGGRRVGSRGVGGRGVGGRHSSSEAEAQREALRAAAATATPAMRQWFRFKEEHPRHLLLFRLGDFYEMFFEDAERASQVLGIALTRRSKDSDIPMAGIPHHSLESHLGKLIRSGVTVGLVEQTETPGQAKRRGRPVIHRELTRIVTPGTLVEDSFLSADSNYLAAVRASTDGSASWAVSWIDVSTGEFWTSRTASLTHLAAELSRIAPSELLVPDSEHIPSNVVPQNTLLTPFTPSAEEQAAEADEKLLGDDLSPIERSAGFTVLSYVREAQRGLPNISVCQRFSSNAALSMDPSSRRCLEITKTLEGEREGSLLHCIDRTVTAMGARLLSNRLSSPLMDVERIEQRLNAVDLFRVQSERLIIQPLIDSFRRCYDMERALQRLTLQYRESPRDLYAVAMTFLESRKIAEILGGMEVPESGSAAASVAKWRSALVQCVDLMDDVVAALVDDPSPNMKERFIRDGYNANLDELRRLHTSSADMIRELTEEYREETGLGKKLRIRKNRFLGYHIHVNQVLDPQQFPEGFIHCQTLATGTRFKTARLTDIETKMQSAAFRAAAVERRLFKRLVSQTMKSIGQVREASNVLATIDVALSGAQGARLRGFTRPVVRDVGVDFVVRGGRHAVVESAQWDTSSFVPNDCVFEAEGEKVSVVTGPNQGGKSTYLRQNALLAILAQAGCFVPAESYSAGLVDAVFTRIGASDDLRSDRGTFMTEMSETAVILNEATPQSLVVMDEVGRGTSTEDGMAIAWAVLEHIAKVNQSRTLFATHYHQLASLQEEMPGKVKNLHVVVGKQGGQVLFTHRIEEGRTDVSLGIEVAQLAGIPTSVIERAQQRLKTQKLQ